MCVVGVRGDLLLWPIKRGFAFDCVLKETDEPAELHDFLLVCHFSDSTPCSSSMFKRLWFCLPACHALIWSYPGFKSGMWCIYSLA